MKQGITEKAKAWPAFYRGTIMNIDLVLKIAATGIIVAVLNQLLTRSGREDQAMMTTLAGLSWYLACWCAKSAICLC